MEIVVNKVDYNSIENIDEPERFIFMYSHHFEDVADCPMADAYSNNKTDLIEGFMKITNEFGKSIYRKFRGINKKSESAYLGYRSMCELGLKNGDMVSVVPTTWFKYLIHNSDSYIRHTVILAILGLACSVLSCIFAIIQLIFCCVC